MSSLNDRMQKSRLRIAYLLVRFPTLYETYVYNEIYYLLEKGIEVEIFAARASKEGPVHQRAQEIAERIPVHTSAALSWAVLVANLFLFIRFPFRYLGALCWVIRTTWRERAFMGLALGLFPKAVYYARLMEQHRIDHIHSHFVWVQQMMAVVISRLIGISTSVTTHAFDLYMRPPSVVREQLQAATRVATISNYNRRFIADLCPQIAIDDVALIRLGLDMEQFGQLMEREQAEVCRLLSIGRLDEKKGHEYLVQACGILVRRGIKFVCTIAGEGDRRAKLEAMAAEQGLHGQLTFMGALVASEVQRLCRESDVFVLPCVVARNGDRDGMPVVLIEAMAMQLPVVSTTVTGIPELVADGEHGFLVPERDATALADVLERLIANPALRRQMGYTARERVLTEFDSRYNAELIAQLFDHAVNTRQPDLRQQKSWSRLTGEGS